MGRSQRGQKEDLPVEGVQRIVDDNLDKVEAQIDSTVEGAKAAVHEMRVESERVAQQALDRFESIWARAQRELEAQVARHPWMVLGGLLIIGYVLSRASERHEASPRR